jgi:hypothetical protein
VELNAILTVKISLKSIKYKLITGIVHFLIVLSLLAPHCCHLHSKKKLKQSRNMPGVAQRLPGGLGSQISMTFST